MGEMRYVPVDIDYLYKMLYQNEVFQILSYQDLKEIPQMDIIQFCHENGFYCFPNKELIDFLRNEIVNENRVIEIGSGNGVIAKALNIKATDSKLQEIPEIKKWYNDNDQPIIKYGKNVEKIDALKAISTFGSRYVIGSWITHKYKQTKPLNEGNEFGVDEHKILNRVKKYIFVGNEEVHKLKLILDIPHKTIKEKWIMSRSWYDKNIIWIWER